MMWILIIGMGIATLLPRIIPVFIVDRLSMPAWLDKWLSAIPYAALGALIFPGVLTVYPDRPHIGFLGAITAVLLSSLGLNIFLILFGSIGVVFGLSFL
ncbi:AzlD domain-containing protein [Metabacillus iocasae]|uniref:Branched-subunit amino acid transport protein n=1 Tax=Priestia iocasae TaxID=2291674 RepID=A0ABS2QXH4_9BACI|nr:AzlD domain-containing protein [Metabacillus iocasae]MBM7703441.1 branched-subunit amino acid transport protein [Metabacillus iocasae]